MAVIDPTNYGARFPQELAPPVEPELVEAFAADALAAGRAICNEGIRLFGVSPAEQPATSQLGNPHLIGWIDLAASVLPHRNK